VLLPEVEVLVARLPPAGLPAVEDGEVLFKQVLFPEYEIVNGALPPDPIPRPSFPMSKILVPPGISTVQSKPVPVLLLVEGEP